MRLFLAIDLPEAVRAHLEDVQAEWRRQTGVEGVRWIPCGNLHLTLKFLGSMADSTLLVKSLEGIAGCGAVHLRTGGVEYFPPRGEIRIVAVDVEGEVSRLRQAVEAMEGVAEALGIARERRPYHPHITLGRARERLPNQLRKQRPPEIAASPDFVVEHFVLYESRLLPAGAEYRKLATFGL